MNQLAQIDRKLRLSVLKCFAYLAIALHSSLSAAQNVSHPGQIPLKQYVSSTYKVSVGFPASWIAEKPSRNELWLVAGELRGVRAGCFVRMSEVQYSGLSKPEELFASVDEKRFTQMLSISMPDAQVKLYDLAYLGGRKARRTIYTGTDDGVKTATITYQALDGDRTFTLACFSRANDFALVHIDFERIASSFTFLGK